MSDLLRVDAGVLETAGNDFVTCGSTVQDTMTRMRNQVTNLRSTFEGSAAQAFYAKMDILFQEMQKLTDEVNEMGADLKTTAGRVREVQAQAEQLLRD